MVSGYGELRKQSLFGHAEIAFGEIRRDVPFVSPEKEDLVPWQLTGKIGCEFMMKTTRRLASGKRDGVACALANGVQSKVPELFGTRPKQLRGAWHIQNLT